MINLLKHQIPGSDYLLGELSQIDNRRGSLIIGSTGCGKTFIIADAIKKAQDMFPEYYKYSDNDMFRLHPIMVLTPRNAITQQQRVMAQAGIRDVVVTSADSLRAGYGDNYIDWNSEHNPKTGEMDLVPHWREAEMPRVIIFDECQYGKNWNSSRTQVLSQFVNQGGKIIFVSATPFQKGIEAKLIIQACLRINTLDLTHTVDVMTGYNATGNSPTAIRKIKEFLESKNRLFTVTGVKYPFKPLINNWLIEPTPYQLSEVNKAYQEYCEERQRLGKGQHQNMIAVWQAQRVMRLKCELLKAENIIELAVRQSEENGKAVILASNFIPTLRKYYKLLTEKYKIPPAKISFLIGNMKDSERQQNIDDFQTGKTLFFLTTLKSGGTGLSLHHEHKTSRPRVVILPPTWSVYELVQVLGRAQRITNLSQVIQTICWFAGTVEEKVAQRLASKYDCIKELMDRKDNFIENVFEKEITGSELLAIETEGENNFEDLTDFVVKEDGVVEVITKKPTPKVEEEESMFDSSMFD